MHVPTWYNEHRRFTQLLLLFVSFRVLVLFFMRVGGIDLPGSPDVTYYFDFARLSGGMYPYLDYWMEFPPLFPWLSVGAYKLALLFAPLEENALFWFNAILRLGLLLFECGSLTLLYATVSRLHNQETGLWTAVAYALAFVPLFVFMGWFDSFVLFFLLLGIYGLVSGQPIITGLGIGLGFGAKLFPVVVLPAAVQVFRHKRRELFTLLGVAALAVLLVFLPFALAAPHNTLAFFQTLSGRISWETIWALLEGYTSYGLVAPLEIRYDPTQAAWLPANIDVSPLPWAWITLAFAALGLFLWTRRTDWTDNRRASAFVGLTFGMMMLYGRGYSPQWAIYPVALALLVMPGLRGMLYAIVIGILTGLEWPIALWVVPDFKPFLTGVVVARTLVVLAFTVECAARYLEDRHWTTVVRRWALPAALAGTLTSILLVLPRTTRYYA